MSACIDKGVCFTACYGQDSPLRYSRLGKSDNSHQKSGEYLKQISYEDAGVNIEKGNESVQRIKKLVKKTFNASVLSEIGLFGGLFEFNAKQYQKPVLVSSTDGVGTKTQIGIEMKRYRGLGADIVGHSINDILVQGAKPLFFLRLSGGREIGCLGRGGNNLWHDR